MYKGIIESESLINKRILKEIKLVRCYKEEHLDEDPSIWTINKIEVDNTFFNSFIKNLSKSIIGGWYSLLWDERFIYVIFRNKIFKIKNANPWINKEFIPMVKYALSLGINKKYFDNLRNSIEKW